MSSSQLSLAILQQTFTQIIQIITSTPPIRQVHLSQILALLPDWPIMIMDCLLLVIITSWMLHREIRAWSLSLWLSQMSHRLVSSTKVFLISTILWKNPLTKPKIFKLKKSALLFWISLWIKALALTWTRIKSQINLTSPTFPVTLILKPVAQLHSTSPQLLKTLSH